MLEDLSASVLAMLRSSHFFCHLCCDQNTITEGQNANSAFGPFILGELHMYNVIIISTKDVSFSNVNPSITTTPCSLCFEFAENGKNIDLISRTDNDNGWGQVHDGISASQY